MCLLKALFPSGLYDLTCNITPELRVFEFPSYRLSPNLLVPPIHSSNFTPINVLVRLYVPVKENCETMAASELLG